MHWICPLYKLSTCWAQQVERIWTPSVEKCWAVLCLVESNLKLVKLFAQQGSTFPLFGCHPCVALHSNTQLVEPTHAQCPAYAKIVMVHSHHFLVACSVLDHELLYYVVVASFTASTPNPRSCFTASLFCPFALMNEFAYSKCSQAFSCSEGMNIPQPWFNIEPLWNLRTAHHVESLLRVSQVRFHFAASIAPSAILTLPQSIMVYLVGFSSFLLFSVLVFVVHLLVYNTFPDRRERSSTWRRTYSRSNLHPLMVHNANAPQRERVTFVTALFEVKGKLKFAISRSATGHKAIFCYHT